MCSVFSKATLPHEGLRGIHRTDQKERSRKGMLVNIMYIIAKTMFIEIPSPLAKGYDPQSLLFTPESINWIFHGQTVNDFNWMQAS